MPAGTPGLAPACGDDEGVGPDDRSDGETTSSSEAGSGGPTTSGGSGTGEVAVD